MKTSNISHPAFSGRPYQVPEPLGQVLQLFARHRQALASPHLHFGVMTVALVAYKLYALEMVSRAFLECRWCLSTRAAPHEIQFVLLLLGLHLLSGAIRYFPFRVLARLVVVLALLIAVVDLAVTQQFWVRLTASDFWKFVGEFDAIFSLLRQLWTKPAVLLLLVCATLAWLVVAARYVKNDNAKMPSLLLCALFGLGAMGCSAVESHEYHEMYVDNALETFFSAQSIKNPYSADFQRQILNHPTPRRACMPDAGRRPDTILVVFESLSMYHSALFSGLHDWMPEFDAIAKAGTRYTNFYANGVTSEQGLVSLLTGEPPIEKGEKSAQTLFEQFRATRQTLPQRLHRNGYESIFLTTGNLGFLGKGAWLKDLGFDSVEGHDAPYYKGMPRYQFDAAPDGALYGRSLQVLDQPHNKPVFMTLETVSTHLPNVDPVTGAHSQELTYRYADHQLGEFVRALKARGFFEHGNLVITADHRAMVPMADTEAARYGDRGFARIPMVVFGKDAASGMVVEQGFSQTDLLPTMAHLTGHASNCLASDQGVFLPAPAHAPQCIFTQRSYSKNDVIAQCGGSDYKIHLDADRTDFADASRGSGDVLNVVHRLRMGQGF